MENLAFSEWGYLEYRRVLAGMLVPTDPRLLSEMCNAFEAILLNRPIYPLNRARNGLRMALQIFQSLRLDAKEVIIPAYICPSVVEAVQAAGLRVVPADIGPDLNIDAAAVEEAISEDTLAVIVAHMYGSPAPIREIEAICHRHGVFLIDDAAQVVSVSVDRQPLGTFGDAGIISFSQSKTVVAGCHNAGGLLIANNRNLETQMAAAYEALPEARGAFWDLTTFFWNYVFGSWTETPTYYWARMFPLNSKPGTIKPEITTKMNNLFAAIALEQLRCLESRIAGRRRIAALYHQKVLSQETITFPQFVAGRYLTRVVLTLPPGIDIAKIRDDLRRKGIRTRRGYPVYGSKLRRRPERALNLQPRLIELPSGSRMSAKTVDKIWSTFAMTLNLQDR